MRMRILVCGSSVLQKKWYELARTVGEAIIAETPHTLLFGGFQPKKGRSADQLLAEGVKAGLEKRKQKEERRVVTVVPEDGSKRKIVGRKMTYRNADPAVRRTAMVGSADLVIGIGGSYGTAVTLYEAHRMRKPIFPLAFTGGASENAWEYYRESIEDALALTGDDIDFIENGTKPWTRHLVRIIERQSGSGHQPVRIVVASPSDVQQERELVNVVADELNAGIAHVLDVALEVTRWETDTFPAFDRAGPQGVVDQRLKIEDADVLVGIFHSRFGSASKDGKTGTEHEIGTAVDAWRAYGHPEVMLYYSTRPFTAKTAEEKKQRAQIAKFRDKLGSEGLWHEYDDPADFERRLRKALTLYLRARFFK